MKPFLSMPAGNRAQLALGDTAVGEQYLLGMRDHALSLPSRERGVDAPIDACRAQPRSPRLPDMDSDDGTKTSVAVHDPCASGTQVAFYTIEGGGHTWPGGEI
jgi:poly(3-hydroxybutyrate) depolymerase